MSRLFSVRPYQAEALDVISRDLEAETAVLLQMATGAGKTVAVCRLINHYYLTTSRKFLILAHKQELVGQFKKTFLEKTEVPETDIGVVCAGLRESVLTRRVTIGTVQTFVGKIDKYIGCSLLVIDEAHRISIGNDSQYDQVINGLRLKHPNMRILGITATPFRLGHGYIYGDDAIGPNLFPRLNHHVKYSTLRDQGYLMPLEGKVAINGQMEADMEDVRTSGDYVLDALEDVMVREIHLETAVQAIAEHCKDFKRICVFCCTINHAETLAGLLGDECTVVHSQLTDWERHANMQAWKTGKKRIITSVNILVEGFDYPPLDCLVMARPTLSSGLYLQAIGRVLRKSEGKDRAFMLDLTTNTKRFGTDLDRVKVTIPKQVQDKIRKEREFEKQCPNCEIWVHIARRECPDCGFVWPEPEIPIADSVPELSDVVFSDNSPVEHDVFDWLFFRHEKKDKPVSMRVEYHRQGQFGTRIASEWICFEHEGYARKRAEDWWNEVKPSSIGDYMPETVEDAMSLTHVLIRPDRIVTVPDGKFTRITKRIYDEVPF